MNLAQLLVDAALRAPNRPAVAHGRLPMWRFSEFSDRVSRLAAGLRKDLGLKTGARIAIAMRNSPEFLEALLAAWHSGLIAVPMNVKLHPREFAHILDDSGAEACFATDDLSVPCENVVAAGRERWVSLFRHPPITPIPRCPDDLAWLFYTSGTTGRPKGAMLSHGNLIAMTEAYFADVDAIEESDCIVHAAPMSHGSGLYIVSHLAKGACQVIPSSGGFDPEEILELLPQLTGATLFMAPTMLMRLVNAPGVGQVDLTGIKTIVYGGGPMYVEDCRRALALLGPKLVQIYGQGESPMTITVLSRRDHMTMKHPRYLERLASVGRAQHGVELRIADEHDNDAALEEVGEVLVRGPTVMKGYWNNPDATAETLRGGWLHTGDLGKLDDDGYLTLKDRSKDVIISGGSNIYPREVEEILLLHEGVAECSVVGAPHPDWGEQVAAFVIPRAGAGSYPSEADLDALCLDNIARFKRPRIYRFIDSLPKNNYGKVLKTVLREMLKDK